MQIDFDQTISGADGEPLKMGVGDDSSASLGIIVSTAMFSTLPGDEKLTGLNKATIGELGLLVRKGGVHEITPEDVVSMRERVGKFYAPLIVARVFAVIK